MYTNTCDLSIVWRGILASLNTDCHISLSLLVRDLQADRRTIEQACRVHGTTFRALRQSARLARALALLENLVSCNRRS